jgi:antitoxin component YwqK of YwqJK toxin-antitoxin module
MGRARWFLVSGFLAAAVLTVILKPWQRELVPAEQVSRNQLVLQQGRLMKTSQTNAFTGLMVEFYPDGTLQSRSAVSNGLLHGVSEGWHTNGVLAITEVFVSGKSHGTRTKWDAASNRIAETDIREGEIEGLHREWHTNGKPSLEVTMARGKAQGVARKWSLEGELAGQWVMSNGVVIQAITNATELGALTQTGGRP